MMQCTTCNFEVEAGRSRCRACDTPVGVADQTTVMTHAPMAPAWGQSPAAPSYPPGWTPPPTYQQPPYPGAVRPPVYGYAPVYAQPVATYPLYVTAQKSKATAAVLCFFLGGFGIHRFYTGQTGIGVAFLLTTLFLTWTIVWIPILFVWLIVDFILILSGGVKDQHGRPLI